MKNIVYSSIALFLGLFIISSCGKSKNEEPAKTDFTINTPDTLVFDNWKTLILPITISHLSGPVAGEFSNSLQVLDNVTMFPKTSDLIIPINDSRNLEIGYTGPNMVPGIYTSELATTQLNINNPISKKKKIYLVSRPNCAFNFANHINGNITYNINGIKVNKSINCNYEIDNSLRVTNLRTFPIFLNMNCSAGTVSVKPVTNNGNLYAGSGTINGNKINLTLTSNGVQDAVAEIFP